MAADLDAIMRECKTLSAAELEELLLFIGYLKFRAATGSESGEKRALDIGDA